MWCWTFAHITCVTILSNFKLFFSHLNCQNYLPIARKLVNVLKSVNTRMISPKFSTDQPSQRHVLYIKYIYLYLFDSRTFDTIIMVKVHCWDIYGNGSISVYVNYTVKLFIFMTILCLHFLKSKLFCCHSVLWFCAKFE